MPPDPSPPAPPQDPAPSRREAWLDAILRSLPLVIFEAEAGSPHGITWIGGSVAEVTGFTGSDWLRQPGLRTERLHPDDRERVIDALGKVRAGHPVEVEFRWQVADGSYRSILERSELAELPAGGGPRTVGSWLDVTGRARQEAALLASRAKYETAFRLSPYAVTLTRVSDEKLIDANEVFVAFTGYSMEEALGHTVLELGLWVEPERRQLAVEPLARTGAFFELEARIRAKDGRIGLGLLSGRRVTIDGEPCVLTVTRDITRQREMEDALRASAQSYRGLFDCVQEAIYIQREDGRFLDVNRGAELMYGLPRDAFIGHTPEVVSAPGRNDLAAVAAMGAKAFAGEPQTFEFWGRRASGEVFPKEVRLYPGTYFGEQVVIAMARDITQRKRAEEVQLQSQKLESLGVLAGGIAHDFNNLLAAIQGNLTLAQLELTPSSAARAHLLSAELTVKSAAQLTRQLLAYSGKGRVEVKVQDLNAVVREMLQLLRVSISRRVRLDLDLALELPAIKADAAQIQQVVMNLLTNASEAIGDGSGVIAVSTRKADLDAAGLASLVAPHDASPGRFAALEVRDTGCGMSPEVLQRIFDPFFTTKVAGRGLGLSAMLGILRGHRAGLRIRSEVGHGTDFQVFFPATDERPEAAEPPPGRSRRHFEGTVLLVDDEEAILRSTGAALRALGFSVVTAREGAEALLILDRDPAAIRLVLMDLTMPGMDGRTAFEAVRRRFPRLPVVLTSGYDARGSSEVTGEDGPAGFLQKPYRLSELEPVLAQALERHPSGPA